MPKKIKIPHGVKLKDLPLETRVALRLVTLAERKHNQAELRGLAKELDSKFADIMKAVEFLAKRAVIDFSAVDANTFAFVLDKDVRADLQLAASNLNRHLAAKAKRGPPKPYVPPLPPFTAEQRAPFMPRAEEIAAKLEAPKLAFKIANCIARIGVDEVNGLMDQAVLIGTSAQKSAVAAFFELYTLRRNALLKKADELPTDKPV